MDPFSRFRQSLETYNDFATKKCYPFNVTANRRDRPYSNLEIETTFRHHDRTRERHFLSSRMLYRDPDSLNDSELREWRKHVQRQRTQVVRIHDYGDDGFHKIESGNMKNLLSTKLQWPVPQWMALVGPTGINTALSSPEADAEPGCGIEHKAPETYVQDPKCRFILLETMATVADLFSVTEDMLFLILTYHQVSPAYLNFLSYFNLYTQTGSSDLRFGGFRSQTFFSDPSSRWIPELGRSGLHYQLSFTLRTVLEREEEKAPFIWSKPQVAIYHQFDVKESRALWILAGPRQQIAHLNPDKSENVLWDQVHSSINANTIPGADTRMVASNDPRQRFTASLETILTICEWSLGDFSFYLQHIEEKLDPLTAPNYEDADATPNASSLQLINYWIQELIYCNIKLKDNIQVLQNIEKFYENLTTEAQVIQKPTSAQNPSNPWTHAAKQQSNITSPKPSTDWLASEACGKDIKLFLEQLNRLIHDVKGIKNRASVLRNLASDREGFIQKLLQNKTEKRLSELSELSHDEAKVMRVFQSITLVLLPPTVIATIFSTDIIKFQDLDGGLYSFSWFAFIMFLVFLVPTFALVYGLFYWKRPEVRVAYYSQSSGKNLGEMEPRYTMVIN